MKLTHITNVVQSDAIEEIKRYSRFWNNVVTVPPKPTKTYTTEELIEKGVVGLAGTQKSEIAEYLKYVN